MRAAGTVERFDLYIHGFRADLAEPPHRALARVFRIEESLARDFVRSLPRVVKRRVLLEDLERYAEALAEIGAMYELRPSPIEPARIIAVEGTPGAREEKPTGRTLTLPPPASSPPPPSTEDSATPPEPLAQSAPSAQPTVLGAPSPGPAAPPRLIASSSSLGMRIGQDPTLPAQPAPSTNEPENDTLVDAKPVPALVHPEAGTPTDWSDRTPVTPMRFDTQVDPPRAPTPEEQSQQSPRAFMPAMPAPTLPTYDTVVQSQELAASPGASAATLASGVAPDGVQAFAMAAARGASRSGATHVGAGFEAEPTTGEIAVGALRKPAEPRPRLLDALADQQRADWVTDDRAFRAQAVPADAFDSERLAALHPAARAIPASDPPVGSEQPPGAPGPRPERALFEADLVSRAPKARYLPGDPMAPPEVIAEVRAASSRPPPVVLGEARAPAVERSRPGFVQPTRTAAPSTGDGLSTLLRAVGAIGLVVFVLVSLRTMSSCDPVAFFAGSADAPTDSGSTRGRYGPFADQWLDDEKHEVASGDKELVRARVYELKSAGAPQVYIGKIGRSGPVRIAKQLVIELPPEEPERQAVIDLYASYLDSEPDEPIEPEEPVLRLEL